MGALFVAALLAGQATCTAAGRTTLHWYGQSAWKIQTPSGGVILIDPWLTVPTNPDRHSIDELSRVDYILITHGHGDHVGDAVDIAKKTGATLVAPYGLMINMVSMLGYPAKQATMATGGNVGGTIDLPKVGAHILIVNAIHGSELTAPTIASPASGHPAAVTSGNPVGYVIKIDGGPTIYDTGDTDVFEDMKLIPMFQHVDLMLACIGDHFTMGPSRAALAVQWVNPTHVIPMHYGTFSLLTGTRAAFREALVKRGIGDKLIVMKPGEDRSF
ncbi:MAG: metal-dependent hydrolase [Gammaproteobacteria bacterium]|nr:metal-dependent hydrolase [Gammaproteobacteria bacterium]